MVSAGAPPMPEWAKPGVVVRYLPHLDDEGIWYLGVIASEPRLLGDHTWVVRLERMEARYHEGRGSVPAARVDALRVVGSVP